ncbi:MULTISPECIES: hypothetical protein [unclassified Sphingomonas]|uniref:hypothetical protein n=1 Tax=unclassified Sphingomonas TaxID=196159 RepID=UPI000701BE66|nr:MULTISPECIES: hypothetical protein [unclassified Sphingomonas]KQX26005.1 hypothetical protein ASD17_00595 [Sphingomonas sp. Root1294]KQY69071.1 hypothetical protein ASD39_01790 [Sphingomonas sp. Root50]KRB89325.1 hypothetical protein ASE22_16705 [Sphingomonas sp. Root720]
MRRTQEHIPSLGGPDITRAADGFRSALRYIHGKLGGTTFFQQIDMVADPDDPRDLFGMLQRAAA